MKKFLTLATASGLGFGYVPVAPGTFGTVPGAIIAFLFLQSFGTDAFRSPWYLLTAASVFAAGVYAAGRAEQYYGRKDPGKIVIDEVCGMLVTLAFLPATLSYITAGFIAFRFFDILKVFPANRVDKKMGGGLGIMLDDVIAGIYANLLLQGYRLLS